jgi:hypothetical protein
VLKRHHDADQLSGWTSTYDNALNDPCTKATLDPTHQFPGLNTALVAAFQGAKLRPGFSMPRGSRAALTARIAASSASERL